MSHLYPNITFIILYSVLTRMIGLIMMIELCDGLTV